MRTSSFSDPEVIDLLTTRFVPVWVSTDNYDGRLTPTDAAEIARYGRHGAVAVTLIAPDGTVLDHMTVTKALRTNEFLLPSLRKVATSGAYKPRDPAAVRRTATAAKAPPPKAVDAALLHVWAAGGRDDRRAEDWVLVGRDEARALVAAAKTPGDRFDVPQPLAQRLARTMYPAVCNYTADQSVVKQARLRATVTAATDAEVRLTLRGAVRVKHNSTDAGDQFPGEITADLIGVVTYDRRADRLTGFRLASEKAEYTTSWQGTPVGGPMAIAVELVPGR